MGTGSRRDAGSLLVSGRYSGGTETGIGRR